MTAPHPVPPAEPKWSDGPTLPNPALHHVPSLDGVRGLAIALVIIVHAYNRGPDIVGTGQNVPALIDQILRFGWSGVELFFVLSGFLISSILIAAKNRRQRLRRFYLHRIARIMPAFLAVCGGVALLGFLRINPLIDSVTHDARAKFPFFLLSINNYMGWLGIDASEADKALGPLWSVASEQQFYLFWPPLIYLLSQRQLRIALPVLLVLNIVVRLLALRAGIAPGDVYIGSISHLDGIIVGSMLAVYRDDIAHIAPLRPAALLASAALILVLTCIACGSTDGLSSGMQHYGYTLLAIAYAMLILAALQSGPIGRTFAWPPFRRLGKYSYFIYLVHWPLLLLLDHIPVPGGALIWCAYVMLLFIVLTAMGALSWRYFEGPIIRLARKGDGNGAPLSVRRKSRAI